MSKNPAATFILDDADNLSVILTASEPSPNSVAVKIESQNIHVNDAELYSGTPINISKHQKLLKINTITTDKKYTVSSNDADTVRQKFLNLFPKSQRSPLAAILDFASLFPPTWDLPAQHDINISLGLETQYILNGIHTLLAIIKKKANVNLGPDVDLFTEVEQSIHILSPLCQKKSCRLINNLNPGLTKLLCVKGAQFKPIFQNVLLNALLHNDIDSEISISQQDINANHIRVQLTGTGIKPESISNTTTQPFNIINSRTYVLEGSGIGLIIVNKLIELIGGGFSIEFSPEQQSCFDMILPIKDYIPNFNPDRPPRYFKHTGQHNNGPQRVLYIEDDEMHIQLVANIFKKLPDITFVSATTSLAGIDLAVSSKPDLILLDIRLPDIDGYDVFSILRSAPTTCDIPIIALSAAAMPHEIARAMKLGFNHYLTKPFQISELVSKVLDGLIQSKQRAAIEATPEA